MAADELTGNMPTENLVSFFEEKNIDLGLNKEAFKQSMIASYDVFGA
jgi:hydroxymethylglutaryl-CoA lyase